MDGAVLFFFNDTATTEIYTLSLHDALPISMKATFERRQLALPAGLPAGLSDGFSSDAAKQAQWAAFLKKNRLEALELADRKSTRLNSSHTVISYAVFCLKRNIRYCRLNSS